MRTPTHPDQRARRLTRVLSCKTYIKRLNVTRQMADNILPCGAALAGTGSGPAPATAAPLGASSDADVPTGGGGGSGGAPERGCGGGGTYTTLFRVPVVLVDEAGTKWTVHYEGTLCRQQRHLRLTAGWPAFIRGQRVGVGDAIVFERRGRERARLWIRIARGGGAGSGAGGAAVQDGLLQVASVAAQVGGGSARGHGGVPVPSVGLAHAQQVEVHGADRQPASAAGAVGAGTAVGAGAAMWRRAPVAAPRALLGFDDGPAGEEPRAHGPSMLSRLLH
jgi:hypothetical protein